MQSVVDNGTGKNAYVAGYKVGGKTGTSTKLGESKEGEKTSISYRLQQSLRQTIPK